MKVFFSQNLLLNIVKYFKYIKEVKIKDQNDYIEIY